MSNFLKALRAIAVYALLTFGVVWSFSWSTHTLTWLIGAILFFIFIVVATIAKLVVDTLKPLKDEGIL